ncbi:MAG: 23S rRNA (adenine(2503)-C(2))-methyltransferase RlmN, partial [Pseudohongiellaceae bacterium]
MTTEMIKTNLAGLGRAALQDFFVRIGEKPFRATQMLQWIHQRGVTEFDLMTDISKPLRQRLQDTAEIRFPEIVQSFDASDG